MAGQVTNVTCPHHRFDLIVCTVEHRWLLDGPHRPRGSCGDPCVRLVRLLTLHARNHRRSSTWLETYAFRGFQQTHVQTREFHLLRRDHLRPGAALFAGL
jgi:hypothetical protein